MPNRLVLHGQYLGDKFEELISEGSQDDKIVSSELIPVFEGQILNERILLKIGEESWCSYLKLEKDSGEFVIDNVCFYYTDSEKIQEIVKNLESITISCESDLPENINILTFSNNSIDIEPLSLDEIGISEIHTKKLVKQINKVTKKISEEYSGITILRGKRGVGKTTISRYIAQNLELTTLIIPLNLVDLTINNPDFKNFLKKFGKCLIVIDDAEYNYGFNKSKSFFSGNVLQFMETLNLEVHFLMVFNCDEEYEIDSDLLESEYLIDEIEIDLVDSERATQLSKKLGFSIEYNDDVTLSRVMRGLELESGNKIGLH